MSKKSKQTQTTSQQSVQTLDPTIRNSVFGDNGYFSRVASTVANNPLKAYEGQTYAGMNDTQKGALQGTLGYLNSPAANAGYAALNQVGGSLLGSTANQIQLPTINAPNLGPAAQFGGATVAPVANVTGATVGGSGINYQQAADRILKGEADNPYLRGMINDTLAQNTESFNRSVMPSLRGGEQLSGQFGGSRAGIAQGIAAGDLANANARATTGLLGSVYENAQNRMGALTGQLSAQDAQARVAEAQMAQQASLANQQTQLTRALQNAGYAQQAGLFNAGAQNDFTQLGAQLGLQADALRQSGLLNAFNANQGAQQQAIQNRIAGAGLLQNASQIPLQNFQTALNVGNAYQQDQQGALTDAYQQFQRNQQLPWTQLGLEQTAIGPFANLGSGQTGNSTTVQTGSGGGSVLGGALGGAQIGSQFGPWGTLIGGIGGGLLGGRG